MAQPQQLALGIALSDDATFNNFFLEPESPNLQALLSLGEQASGAGEQLIYLWGAEGVGLTHLLQACCHQAANRGLRSQYIPLRDLSRFSPDSLCDDLSDLDLVCLDDVDTIAGKAQWEQALFHLFNRLRDSGRRLLVAAHQSPKHLGVSLPDLHSRLSWGITFQIQPMSDVEKCKALQLRAHTRGLDLSEEVSLFIVHRAPRDMNQLFEYLDELDQASLAEQRKLTIPFVKRVLGF
ncbi:DnaA regulatory inactivator Hda [Marinibactrum halimedae]|uniref:DnaA regulatory inactivator Hda n=1 Tax=Marinibactrum halimedae TaxID=1444977 RepID=A0AA37WP01_9GAMM|nr:DnaA regulatory inactivator Hda [Marinibactrum halimedae]MCD9457485.1 DnaA regulatory inactivator Hda [Marinibactrum halimedae]GLS25462.1 DnaA regulatory inactivator Hda [Marinibactrum halimedae]